MSNDVAQRRVCPSRSRCLGPANCDAAGNCQHPFYPWQRDVLQAYRTVRDLPTEPPPPIVDVQS